jgi:hypothetical protein
MEIYSRFATTGGVTIGGGEPLTTMWAGGKQRMISESGGFIDISDGRNAFQVNKGLCGLCPGVCANMVYNTKLKKWIRLQDAEGPVTDRRYRLRKLWDHLSIRWRLNRLPSHPRCRVGTKKWLFPVVWMAQEVHTEPARTGKSLYNPRLGARIDSCLREWFHGANGNKTFHLSISPKRSKKSYMARVFCRASGKQPWLPHTAGPGPGADFQDLSPRGFHDHSPTPEF